MYLVGRKNHVERQPIIMSRCIHIFIEWTYHFLLQQDGRERIEQNNIVLMLSHTLTTNTWRVGPTTVENG